eukprot:5722480-Prymnesium_polylepis.2
MPNICGTHTCKLGAVSFCSTLLAQAKGSRARQREGRITKRATEHACTHQQPVAQAHFRDRGDELLQRQRDRYVDFQLSHRVEQRCRVAHDIGGKRK